MIGKSVKMSIKKLIKYCTVPVVYISFWDSLIVGSAVKSGCKRLYSEDMQYGLIVENELKIINPFNLK